MEAQHLKPLRIGIVAGEISGDILGAGLIQAIKTKYPHAEFVGIGGPKMKALGCHALFDMEELAVMGLVEVLCRLPRLFEVKRKLVEAFTQNPPDVFVGIDAPDFNLRLEKDLKQAGIKTVHYVSPSVWAWRQKRIFSIQEATNLVLALLPFEKAFYDKHNVPCEFVGHAIADDIPLVNHKEDACAVLSLDPTVRYMAVLPGSRGGELKQLASVFIETCRLIKAKHPDIVFVVAAVNQKRREQFEQAWKTVAPELDFVIIDGHAREVMAASDAVLLASGTVSLECLLVKRPMVVAYRMNAITAMIVEKMLKTDFVALPNILAGRKLVSERLQNDCTPEALAADMEPLLNTDNNELMATFTEIHKSLRLNSNEAAAKAVLNLIGLTA